MNKGKYVFSQVMTFFPRWIFEDAVKRYNGDFHAKNLNSYSHCLHLMFGQLAGCNSLKDITLVLRSVNKASYHLGIPTVVDPSSLSKANESRDYRIFEELGMWLIRKVRPMYEKEKIPDVYLPGWEIFAIDSTTIPCSIKLAEWALGKYSKGGVKMHTVLDLRLVEFYDAEKEEIITFLTNNFELGPLVIANIYHNRWQIETFFKWIKGNLTIKALWGYSENAVKIHLWVAISTYLLLAWVKAALKSPLTITEVSKVVGASLLTKNDIRDLLAVTAPLTQNQNVNELELNF